MLFRSIHTLEIPKFTGWMRLQGGNELGKEERGILLYLKSLNPNLPFSYKKIESNVEVTGFHSHYTESGLIQKLEDLGIGRPSTYAMFVETIQDRGYVKNVT